MNVAGLGGKSPAVGAVLIGPRPHKKDHIRVVDEAAQFLRTASRARAAIVLDITEGAKPILAKLRSRQSQ